MAHESYVGNDIYCDWILSGKLPVDIVAETEEVLAFHHSQGFDFIGYKLAKTTKTELF